MRRWDLVLVHAGEPAAAWLERYWRSGGALEPRLLHSPELVRTWVLSEPVPDGVLLTTTGPGDWRWDLLTEIRRAHPLLPVLVVLVGHEPSLEAARRQGATVAVQAGGPLALRAACRTFRAHLPPAPSRRI